MESMESMESMDSMDSMASGRAGERATGGAGDRENTVFLENTTWNLELRQSFIQIDALGTEIFTIWVRTGTKE